MRRRDDDLEPGGGGGGEPKPTPEREPTTVIRPTGHVVPVTVEPTPEPTPVDETPDEVPDEIIFPEYTDPPGGDTGGDSKTDVDRRMTINSTILGGILGPVYGQRRVDSLCMFLNEGITALTFAQGYCIGESVSVSSVGFPDPAEPSPEWLIQADNHVGEADSGNHSWLFPTSVVEYYPGIVYTAFSAYKNKLGALPNLTALIAGKKIHDFRDAAYPADTTTNHSNPALVAFDICTDQEMWKSLDVVNVNTDQLKEIADWCDEQVDGEDRWHYHGRLDVRDSDAALTEVLAHCRTTYYVYDRTIHFHADMPPRPLDSTWTNSGTTFACVGSGNATDYDAGDVVLVYDSGDHYVYEIDSITDDDTFVVTETPLTTHTSVQVRRISDVYIRAENLTEPPKGSYRDPAESPDVVVVKYRNETETDWKLVRCEDPDGYDVGNPKQIESSLNGCKTPGMAARWGHHERRGLAFRPFGWEFSARGSDVSRLQPGDVLRFDTLEGPVGMLVRLTLKDEDVFSGVCTCTVQEFDMGVYSDDVADEDSLPDDYFEPVLPVLPSSVTQTLVETGDWDGETRIADPDDISGWTKVGSNLTITYDSVEDETTFELTGGPHSAPYEYIYLDVTSDIKSNARAMFHFLVRGLGSNHTTDAAMRVEYWAGADHASATMRGMQWISPYMGADGTSELYHRGAYWFSIVDTAYHEVRFVVGAAIDLTGIEPEWAIKRCRLVAWGTQGDVAPTIDGSHPLFPLGLSERFEWVEGAGADVANSSYTLKQGEGWDTIDLIIESVKREVSVIEHDHISHGGSVLIVNHLNFSSGTDLDRGFYMVATSVTGHTAKFPDATQVIEGSESPPAEEWWRTSYHTIWDPESARLWTWHIFEADSPSDIATELWDDYTIELWVDFAGGTDYQLLAACPWGTKLGFGFSQYVVFTGYDDDVMSFAYTSSSTIAESATYILRLRNKYTGKRTTMTEAGHDDVSGSAPDPPTPTLTSSVFHSDTYVPFSAPPTTVDFLMLEWTIPSPTGSEDNVGHFRFETWNSATGVGSIVRAYWYLYNPESTFASWSEDTPATFSFPLPIPSGHDQIRVIAVGQYGQESESAWDDIDYSASVTYEPNPCYAEPVTALNSGTPEIVFDSNGDIVTAFICST